MALSGVDHSACFILLHSSPFSFTIQVHCDGYCNHYDLVWYSFSLFDTSHAAMVYNTLGSHEYIGPLWIAFLLAFSALSLVLKCLWMLIRTLVVIMGLSIELMWCAICALTRSSALNLFGNGSLLQKGLPQKRFFQERERERVFHKKRISL